jgi:hypothetical protein
MTMKHDEWRTPDMGKRQTSQTNPEQVAKLLLKGLNSPHVVVGPLLWQPSDGAASKAWYFMVATFVADKGLRIIRVDAHDEMDRLGVIAALARRPPLVVHLMEDELDMAKLCEAIWPCERTSRMRANLEAEHVAGRSP